MKPLVHAKSSVAKWGGKVEDYLSIHNFFDSSKAAMADVRHRAMFHSAFGIYLVETIFGVYITNSDGRQVSVRDIGEQHVVEDLGFIPSMEQWFRNMPIQDWMNGKREGIKRKHIPMKDEMEEDIEFLKGKRPELVTKTRFDISSSAGRYDPHHELRAHDENVTTFYNEANTD